ncbi:regulatory protein GemA [Methylogaea oryzae]|uniref:GemA protein n=1 Tax=Methylogaea oryzae TaxID=1295382 RepID=A0A8D4VNK4_9GAMM|nr:regulatory protein GemA [Methylogaea oryzae]BBL70352.1 GemA protein [Methylogaea oryzae]
MSTRTPDLRQRELGKIHLLAKRAGMDRDAYEHMLREVSGIPGLTSSKQLTPLGRGKVLDHLARITGAVDPNAGRPNNLAERPLLRKIGALLADSGRPWAYVTKAGKSGTSMVQRLAGVDALEFATDEGLLRIVAALEIDKKRRAR